MKRLLMAYIKGGGVDIPHAIPAASFGSGSAGFSFVFVRFE